MQDDELVTGDDLLAKEPPPKSWISTGCTLLDLVIADRLPGGFPAGRICQIYGEESTAKSVVVQEALGSAQRQGGHADMDDVEGTLDLVRAQSLFGINVSKAWTYGRSTSIEDLFDRRIPATIEQASKYKGPSCQVVDSLSALASEAEKNQALTDATMGTSRAKQLSLAFRKIINQLNESSLSIIFVDQTRTNVGQTFGDSSTTSGGAALKFYASVRLKLSFMEKITNSYGNVIGVKLGCLAKKNKIGPPFRSCDFRLLFDYGIDDIATSLEWLHEHDVGEKRTLGREERKRAPWGVPALKLTGRGLYDLVEKVETQNLEKELRAEVERVWHCVYRVDERKPRCRFDTAP